MLPLEVLLKEEQEVLGRPAGPDIYQELAEMLPHSKHIPYYSVLNSRGRLIKFQENPKFDILIEDEQRILAKRERHLLEATHRLEQKYGITIPPEIIEQYLVEFAGRILDYARSRLPGIFLKDDEMVQLAGPLTGEKTEDARRIAKIIVKPDILASVDIENISNFYAQAMKN